MRPFVHLTDPARPGYSPRETTTTRLGRLAASALLLAGAGGALAPAPVPAEPQAAFSPDGGIQGAPLGQIDEAASSIEVAIFDFTPAELAAGLVRARTRGVAVRVVADARQTGGKHSAIPRLMPAGIEARFKLVLSRSRPS